MKFRTEIEPLPGHQGDIDHRSVVFTLGSCFADNIGDAMLRDGFDVEVNPLGALYNPASIRHAVEELTEGKSYTPTDFFEHEGKWRSYNFHSIFAKSTPEASAAMVNDTLGRLRSQLPRLTHLVLTLGSARCFALADSGRVVANCHKQHPSTFVVRDLTLDECVGDLTAIIELVRAHAPLLRQVLLTVSPIRHKAYGLHADRISKSTLLLACDEVCRHEPLALYFPSYEIMMDDLRDYRFYAADMVHPSELAVDYIYDIFSASFYSPATARQAQECRRQWRRGLHRPNS